MQAFCESAGSVERREREKQNREITCCKKKNRLKKRKRAMSSGMIFLELKQSLKSVFQTLTGSEKPASVNILMIKSSAITVYAFAMLTCRERLQ